MKCPDESHVTVYSAFDSRLQSITVGEVKAGTSSIWLHPQSMAKTVHASSRSAHLCLETLQDPIQAMVPATFLGWVIISHQLMSS